MNASLLLARRFLPLFISQFLGALNDNLLKNALVVLAVFRLAEGGTTLVAIAGGLFTLPYLLLSALAGQLADRFDKSRLIRVVKSIELPVMALAAWGLIDGNIPVLLATLFLLGVQATFFSPLKYGIIPEHLAEAELLRGNALIEAGTFAAILIGTIAGGELIGLDAGPTIVAVAGLVIAGLGIAAAFAIPSARPAAPGLRINPNIAGQTATLLRTARANRSVWLCILGLSWFWMIGGTFLAVFPSIAKDSFHGDNQLVTLLLTAFAVGVGGGSILAGRLAHGEVSARHVPFAALLLSVFTWGFAAISAQPGAGEWHSPVAMLSHPMGCAALACLLGAAACGGLFSVPLYAIIQDRSDPAQRASMIAANNVMNAVFLVLGTGGIAALTYVGAGPSEILTIAAGLNLLVALLICRLLPADVIRAVFQWYFRTFHRVRISGLEHLPPASQRAVVVSNHQSFLDGCLLAAFLPGRPVFAVDTFIAKAWWARLFLGAVDVLTVDPTNPFAARSMVRAVQAGQRLVIFPEGRITKTGSLMKVYDGAGMVADRADAVLIVVRIDGLKYSKLSRLRGVMRLRWFPPVSMTVLPPVRLQVSGALAGRGRRQALGMALLDVMVNAEVATRNTSQSLFAALLGAARLYGPGLPIIEDLQFAPLSYGKVVLGATVLGRALTAGAQPGERIGILLPNANATVVTFFGLQAYGHVPAMLNFSAGAEALRSACRAAEVTTVVSSRAFIEKGKLGALVASLEGTVRFIWLEEVRAGLGRGAKLRGWVAARAPGRLPGAHSAPDAPAVVLFTSGSEGAPKGVVLSHRNILANIAQVAAVVDVNPTDRMMNAMPVFHSFGLTAGTLLPMLLGIRTFFYPSPLHYRVIPEIAYGMDATITVGTDTFLTGWARYANPYDLRTTRYVVAGAEKVREETRRLYSERFGTRIFEGYGVTETAPVLAVNTPMHNRPGTVGRLLSGIEYRIEAVAGIEQGGRLHVRGPNVMLGYLRAAAPGVLEPPPEGWYDTGDIVAVDEGRYVTILGRAKRFAKIAGEMVSMVAAETLASGLWPGAQHAVLSLPDARKGEQLVLLTTQPGAEARALLDHARAQGVPEIQVPRSVRVIDKMPLLGTGKVDYPSAQKLLVNDAALQPAAE